MTLSACEATLLKQRLSNTIHRLGLLTSLFQYAEHLHVLQMAAIGAKNSAMINCIAEGQKRVECLKGQLREGNKCWQKARAENCKLRQDVDALTKRLQVCITTMPCGN